MQAKELIKKLRSLPPGTIVKVWDARNDCESYDVKLSINQKGEVFILGVVLGTEV